MPTFNNGGSKAILRGYLNDTGLRKNNFSNTRAPLATDNTAQGYELGSAWLYNGSLYTLTAFSGANATWTRAQGLKGDTGDQGARGTDGTNGTDGANGLSAYELAVSQGFVGSLSDWLDSLKGADGADATNNIRVLTQSAFNGLTLEEQTDPDVIYLIVEE